MNMEAVKSSTIESIGYDGDTKTLRIKFKSGATYDYADVPYETHADLMSAPSIGKHFHSMIRLGPFKHTIV